MATTPTSSYSTYGIKRNSTYRREACRDPDNVNWLASSLVERLASDQGDMSFNPRRHRTNKTKTDKKLKTQGSGLLHCLSLFIQPSTLTWDISSPSRRLDRIRSEDMPQLAPSSNIYSLDWVTR
jgi:hypothetical protein